MSSVHKGVLSMILVLGIMLLPAHSSLGVIRISVMISQRNEISSMALESFLRAIIDEYDRTAIFTYDLKGRMETGAEIAGEIHRAKPDLVLAMGTTAALTAKEAIKDIPIVFCMVLNPVSSGLVEKMNAPGGNVTGASLDIPLETQFQYIKSVIGDLGTVGVIYNPAETGRPVQQATRVAGRMNLSFLSKPVSSEREVPAVLGDLLGKIDVLWSVADGTVFGPQSTQYILENTLRTGTPFVGLSYSFVKAGALMALSCDYADIGSQAAESAHRILKGENPKNIPVSVPRKVTLSLNLRTAKHIGLRVPESMVRSANEVIE